MHTLSWAFVALVLLLVLRAVPSFIGSGLRELRHFEWRARNNPNEWSG